jgi:hypothetical protein
MKRIKDYENYSITEDGKVWSHFNSIYVKQNANPKGYLFVNLYNKNGAKKKRVHRLVAEAYIPNLENKPFINHINCDKKDNNISNLEWCTCSENAKHAWDNGLQKRQRGNAKKVLNVKTNQIFRCITDAANSQNIKYDTLKKKLNGTCRNNTDFILA